MFKKTATASLLLLCLGNFVSAGAPETPVGEDACPWAGHAEDAFEPMLEASGARRFTVARGVRSAPAQVAGLLRQAESCGWSAELAQMRKTRPGMEFEIHLSVQRKAD